LYQVEHLLTNIWLGQKILLVNYTLAHRTNLIVTHNKVVYAVSRTGCYVSAFCFGGLNNEHLLLILVDIWQWTTKDMRNWNETVSNGMKHFLETSWNHEQKIMFSIEHFFVCVRICGTGQKWYHMQWNITKSRTKNYLLYRVFLFVCVRICRTGSKWF
jgi:hypothetical protein